MITFQLNDHEQQELIELLERELPNLRHEIHHTDDHDYREFLKERERLLERLLNLAKSETSAMSSDIHEVEKQPSI